MKQILLFGAGKSATVLIEYLQQIVHEKNWHLTVADNNLAALRLKLTEDAHAAAVELFIEDAAKRKALIEQADVVISLMPPALHYLVAIDCLACGKNLLTASYVDEKIRALQDAVKEKGLLFLCEMGLDPGIDHMSAMRLINRIKEKGGKIKSFVSHCGGLVAPESDNNPWHYKISWNPKSVVLAGKAGAVYREKAMIKTETYETVFAGCGKVFADGLGELAYYLNRDSLSYLPVYGLEDIDTFMRTTLRHPDFCRGWQLVIELGLTDETVLIDTNGLSVADFFKKHFVEKNLLIPTSDTLLKEQFIFLGLEDQSPINQGICSSADVFQTILEKKWALNATDRDMIVMMHEMESEVKNERITMKSVLIVKGANSLHTAMAKTVGLPLGITATLLLEGKIAETGLHIPIVPGIYEPVLEKLEEYGIVFEEKLL